MEPSSEATGAAGLRQATTAPRPLSVPGAADERDLVERARRGDHDAFARLVDRRLASTFRTVAAILGDEADVRDASQAIFVRTWRNLPSLRDADRFDAWFGRIVINVCRSSMRARQRRDIREISVGRLPDGGEMLATSSAGPDDATADLDRLERAFDRLPAADRVLLWLHHHEDRSLTEIGDRLGIAPKTVKSRLFSARRALEHALRMEDR